MLPNNAFTQYKTQSLSTMTQGELLVRLFDELVKQCHLAVISIGKNDMINANNSLLKAQTIVSTLDSSLDMRVSISEELHNLYVFFARQLLEANTGKNAKIVQEIIPLFKDLRESFDQAEKISRRNQFAAGGKAV